MKASNIELNYHVQNKRGGYCSINRYVLFPGGGGGGGGVVLNHKYFMHSKFYSKKILQEKIVLYNNTIKITFSYIWGFLSVSIES